MDAKIFIEEVNEGKRDFDSVTVDGVVDLDLIKFGPEEWVRVNCIRVLKYDKDKHIQISASVFVNQYEGKIPL